MKSRPDPAAKRRKVWFCEFVLEQLASLPDVEARAMFGGYGLYAEGVFFAIIHREALYLRTDSDSRADYVARGMEPFRPNARQTLSSYYEVPADVIESSRRLSDWARRALNAGCRGK